MDARNFPVVEPLALRLAHRLRDRRLSRGWSRRTLGARALVSPETLRAFERTGQISLPRLVRLCVALGLDEELERLFTFPVAPESLDDLLPPRVTRKRGR